MKIDALDEIVDQVVERLIIRVLRDDNPMGLDPRDFDIILALGQGLGNQEIGDLINKSPGVVANSIMRLTKKTGMGRDRLVLYGGLLGLATRKRAATTDPVQPAV